MFIFLVVYVHNNLSCFIARVFRQLGNVLEALGVEVTEERLREAFTELIPGCSGEHPTGGTLSLEDFEAWWNANETT